MDRKRLRDVKLLLLLQLACLQAVVCETFLESCDVGDDGLPHYFSLDDDITYTNNADIIQYLSLNSIKYFNVSIDGVSLLRTYMGHFATVSSFSEQKCIGAILLQAPSYFVSVSGKFNELIGEYEHDCGGCAEHGILLPPDDSTVLGEEAFWSYLSGPFANDTDVFVKLGQIVFGRSANIAYSYILTNSFSRVFLVEFEPVCIDFDDFINHEVKHGASNCRNVEPSSTCDILCVTGFHLASGNSKFTCDPSREPQWIGDASCQPTLCQPFDRWINVSNSVNDCELVDHDSTCDISCDIGFSLESVGTERYKCDPVNAPDWTHSEFGPAVCEETLCHESIDVKNASSICDSVAHDSTCDVVCDIGFSLESVGTEKYRCDPARAPEWTHSELGPAVCEETLCHHFDQWINVSSSVSECDRVAHDSTCDISCDIGFHLKNVGTEKYTCDPAHAPEWTPSELGPAVCEKTFCHQFDQWINVSNSVSACDRVDHYCVCDVSCDIGFSLKNVGTEKYTCDPANAPDWTPAAGELEPAVCEQTLCHNFQVWLNVSNAASTCESVDQGATCAVSCAPEYALATQGSELYTCDPNTAPEWKHSEAGAAVCTRESQLVFTPAPTSSDASNLDGGSTDQSASPTWTDNPMLAPLIAYFVFMCLLACLVNFIMWCPDRSSALWKCIRCNKD